jgi:predicted MFS family arabinose efflux permease
MSRRHGSQPFTEGRHLAVTEEVDTDNSRRLQPLSPLRLVVVVGGVCLISIAGGAYELVPASVTPLITESMGISKPAAGFVVGVMFGAAGVGSIPVGITLDRVSSRRMMAAVVLTLVVVGIWGWIAADRGAYGHLIASRIIGGFAFVTVWNAGIDIVSEVAPAHRHATAVGIFTASAPLGFALGHLTGPMIANRFGWPAIFVVFAGLALLGLAVFWRASRGLGIARDTPSSAHSLRKVFANRPFWVIAAIGFLGYSVYLFINGWGPTYLNDSLDLTLGESGALVALFPAVGVLSRVTTGVLSDRVFGGRRRPVLVGSFVLATPLLALFATVTSLPLLVVALLGIGFAVQLSLGLSFTYVRELVDSDVAGTAVSVLTAVGTLGSFLTPIVGGAIIEQYSYRLAFAIVALFCLVGVGLAWVSPEP